MRDIKNGPFTLAIFAAILAAISSAIPRRFESPVVYTNRKSLIVSFIHSFFYFCLWSLISLWCTARNQKNSGHICALRSKRWPGKDEWNRWQSIRLDQWPRRCGQQHERLPCRRVGCIYRWVWSAVGSPPSLLWRHGGARSCWSPPQTTQKVSSL